MSATTETPFFNSFAKQLVSPENAQALANPARPACPPSTGNNKIQNDGSCAGQAGSIAKSTADLQKAISRSKEGQMSKFQSSSGVNVQGCVTNNFDTNASVAYGLASMELADDTSVGCEQEALASSLMLASTDALSCQVANVCNDTSSNVIVEIDQAIDLTIDGTVEGGSIEIDQEAKIDVNIRMTDSAVQRITNHINQNISTMIQNLQKTSQSRSTKGVGGTAHAGSISMQDNAQSSNMVALSQQMNNVSNTTTKMLKTMITQKIRVHIGKNLVGVKVSLKQQAQIALAAVLSTAYTNILSQVQDQSVQNALKNAQITSQKDKAIGADTGLKNSKWMMIAGAVALGVIVIGMVAGHFAKKKKGTGAVSVTTSSKASVKGQ